jgi:D-3-phosphoglycerate dehydrogenase / 2-oxoglutarate reductase
VLSAYNVVAQLLMTRGEVGYLIVEVDKAVSKDVKKNISALKSNIRTRILY